MHNKVIDAEMAAVRVLRDGVGERVLPLVDFCEDSYLRRAQQNENWKMAAQLTEQHTKMAAH